MEESVRPGDRIMSVAVLAATVMTIAYNGLAATGYVNGVTPAAVSAKYPTVLTPAGWAFSIWSLIYVWLIAFSIFQLMPSTAAALRRVRIIYVASCIFNCAWIYFWHHDHVAVCLMLIAALLISLLVILWNLRTPTLKREGLFARAPFGLYAGWVTAATLINLNVFLTANDPSAAPQGWNVLGIVCILAAAVAGVAARFKLHNFLFPLALAWAATAIAVKQSGNTAIVVASAVCVIICLLMSVSFVMDQRPAAA